MTQVNPTLCMSVDLEEAYKQADEYQQKLKATDFHPYEYVELKHTDGTYYKFASAFARKLWVKNNKYIAVFTEHQGTHVFSEGDLDVDAMEGGYSYYRIKILNVKKLSK